MKETISNLPVIIVEKNVLVNLIDNSILERVKDILEGKMLDDDNLKIHNYKFRIIPFTSLGNKNGLLLGFKPDFIKIYNEDDIVEKKAVIGIYEEALSGYSNEYNAIIGL